MREQPKMQELMELITAELIEANREIERAQLSSKAKVVDERINKLYELAQKLNLSIKVYCDDDNKVLSIRNISMLGEGIAPAAQCVLLEQIPPTATETPSHHSKSAGLDITYLLYRLAIAGEYLTASMAFKKLTRNLPKTGDPPEVLSSYQEKRERLGEELRRLVVKMIQLSSPRDKIDKFDLCLRDHGQSQRRSFFFKKSEIDELLESKFDSNKPFCKFMLGFYLYDAVRKGASFNVSFNIITLLRGESNGLAKLYADALADFISEDFQRQQQQRPLLLLQRQQQPPQSPSLYHLVQQGRQRQQEQQRRASQCCRDLMKRRDELVKLLQGSKSQPQSQSPESSPLKDDGQRSGGWSALLAAANQMYRESPATRDVETAAAPSPPPSPSPSPSPGT